MAKRRPLKPSALALAEAPRNPLTGEYLPRGRDEAVAAAVEMAAGLGFSAEEIAVLCRVDVPALQSEYAQELAGGGLRANHEVAAAFLLAARSGEDWRASEAWLRYRAGWEDRSKPQAGDILIEINLG